LNKIGINGLKSIILSLWTSIGIYKSYLINNYTINYLENVMIIGYTLCYGLSIGNIGSNNGILRGQG